MKTLFPYIGESILHAVIEENPQPVLSKFKICQDREIQVHQQVKLAFPRAGISFDGFQRLDLGLLIRQSESLLIPIEVKLGKFGLGRSSIDNRLDNCKLSDHANKRISGNILAVLNRYFSPELLAAIGNDKLHAEINGEHVPVFDDWGIIARASIIRAWRNKDGCPRFNGKQKFIPLEEICPPSKRNKFNELTLSVIKSDDYYRDWIEKDFD